MDQVLDTIIERIVNLVSPDRIILFGSRGAERDRPDSDYDILVIKRGVANRRATAQEIYCYLVDVPAAVDVLVDTPERFEKHRHSRGLIYAEAAKGRVVYER